jgi:hypothetical protein
MEEGNNCSNRLILCTYSSPLLEERARVRYKEVLEEKGWG